MDYPKWDSKGSCFPPGPLYLDKLERTEPYTRACDLENKLAKAKEKAINDGWIPFNPVNASNESIIQECSEKIMENLQPYVVELGLEGNNQIQGVKNMLKGLIRGRMGELRNPDQVIQTIQELQGEALEAIETKSRDWQNYSAR